MCVYPFLTASVYAPPQELGYSNVNWDVDTEDWRVGNDPPVWLQLLDSQLSKLKNSSIIHLQHDLQPYEASVVPFGIQYIRQNFSNHQFVTMERCLWGGVCLCTGFKFLCVFSIVHMCVMCAANYQRHPTYVWSRKKCPEPEVPQEDSYSCALSDWSSW